MIWKQTSSFVFENQLQISLLTRSLITVIQANGGRNRSPQFILSRTLTDSASLRAMQTMFLGRSPLMVPESEMSYPHTALMMRNR
jgi:hypothetical protein